MIFNRIIGINELKINNKDVDDDDDVDYTDEEQDTTEEDTENNTEETTDDTTDGDDLEDLADDDDDVDYTTMGNDDVDGDENSAEDNADSNNEDDNTENGGDTETNTDDSADDSTEEDGDNLKSLEKGLFEDLTPEQMAIKNGELLQNYMDLYNIICKTFENVDKITKTYDNTRVLEFILDKLVDLKEITNAIIVSTYTTRTYVENLTEYKKILLILSQIKDMIKSLNTGKNDQK